MFLCFANNMEESCCGVVANMPDCDIVIRSCYYVCLWTNTMSKAWTYPPCYVLFYNYHSFTRIALAWNYSQFDMPLNKEIASFFSLFYFSIFWVFE